MIKEIFNRNILYCKFAKENAQRQINANLIGTFCIVNYS